MNHQAGRLATELLRAGPPIKKGAVLGFLAVRNEALRLPAVLDHHRRIGINQFVIVDNDSNDGTRDLLAAMPDVRLYSTSGSFAASKFGLEWLHPLLDELADNHWALTPRCRRTFCLSVLREADATPALSLSRPRRQ